MDILFIALTAMISGAEDYVTIKEYGRNKEDWFKNLLELPNGIPSHDTFRRVFARLVPQELEKCLISWSEQLRSRTDIKDEEVIALDGKLLRHSFDNAMGVSATGIVSAWACRARLCLGQVKVAQKSNEITAVPALLKLLDIDGCLVTADALNCQKATAAILQISCGRTGGNGCQFLFDFVMFMNAIDLPQFHDQDSRKQ